MGPFRTEVTAGTNRVLRIASLIVVRAGRPIKQPIKEAKLSHHRYGLNAEVMQARPHQCRLGHPAPEEQTVHCGNVPAGGHPYVGCGQR